MGNYECLHHCNRLIMAVLAFFVTYEVKTITITTLNATILS